MPNRAALLQLAGLIGVEVRYTDALGKTWEVSNDSLLALIGAFGLPSDPVHAQTQLEEQRNEMPLELPPAQVVHAEDTRPQIALRLPRGCRQIAWTCRLEDGDERSGRVAVNRDLGERPFVLTLPVGLPLGYHRFEILAGRTTAKTVLIVAPDR